MKQLLFVPLFLISIKLTCQNLNDWYLKCDSLDQKCGYVDKDGIVKIEIGKYPICLTDTFINYAIVYTKELGYCLIDKSEHVLFKIYEYDNGPDYTVEGLYRIVVHGKIGFANDDGNIVINPSFDFVKPFENGLAEFCVECKQVRQYEHFVMEGGKWGFIDKTGKVVVAPIFFKKSAFDDRYYIKKKNAHSITKEEVIRKYRKG
ncbi:MAG: WG repeat-containing protein [Saprospiraceae bacterium]|nr:WG repeat-containing protein [Saprospiraceae bacterium]